MNTRDLPGIGDCEPDADWWPDEGELPDKFTAVEHEPSDLEGLQLDNGVELVQKYIDIENDCFIYHCQDNTGDETLDMILECDGAESIFDLEYVLENCSDGS